MEFKTALEYLEELAIEVVNNRFNDKGSELYKSFFAVLDAFKNCGVYKDLDEFDKAYLIADQIYKLYNS